VGASANEEPSDASRREALLDRVERATELPLMVLSFAMVPLIAAPVFWDLAATARAVVLTLGVLIWALLCVDFAVRLAIAPGRGAYLRAHWLDAAAVLIPVARPLRIAQIALFGSSAYRSARRLAQVDFLAVYATGLVLVVATIVLSVERNTGSAIDSFPDALWWAVATVTTVGYGDLVPITQTGRAFAYILMIGGIGLFGVLTANVASAFVRRRDPNSAAVIAALTEEVHLLRAEVARLAGRTPEP